uniref:Uncharacterized protein n=1 Tax=Plectus sambesii TaxID=2011161 RepID=A0A914XSG3_9BILA
MISTKSVNEPKSFCGVPGRTRCCLHPVAPVAYIFDCFKSAFVRIDLKSGRHFTMETEQPKTLVGEKIWYDVHCVIRASETYAIALILDHESGKYCLISFLLKEEKAAIVEECQLNLKKISADANWGSIQQDANGQICGIVYWRFLDKATRFHAVRIDVDESGMISNDILANNCRLEGAWHLPTFSSNAIVWLPFCAEPYLFVLNVSYDATRLCIIKVENHSENWPLDGSTWISPVVADDKAVFYTFNAAKKLAQIHCLDWKEKCWRELRVDANDHIISGSSVVLKRSQDGKRFLHGECSNAFCSAKAHISVI